MVLSHFEAVIILFSTIKLRSFFIFHFESSSSLTTKLPGLKMEEHLTLAEHRGVISKSLDNKLKIKCLESFKNGLCSFAVIKSFCGKSSSIFLAQNPIFITLSLSKLFDSFKLILFRLIAALQSDITLGFTIISIIFLIRTDKS